MYFNYDNIFSKPNNVLFFYGRKSKTKDFLGNSKYFLRKKKNIAKSLFFLRILPHPLGNRPGFISVDLDNFFHQW